MWSKQRKRSWCGRHSNSDKEEEAKKPFDKSKVVLTLSKIRPF